MATRPLPPGTVNVTCNIPKDLHRALQILSAKSGMKIGTYVRHILATAEKKKVQYQATITEVTEPLAESQPVPIQLPIGKSKRKQ